MSKSNSEQSGELLKSSGQESDEAPYVDAWEVGSHQKLALEGLLTGKSVAETARSAGVSRTTIYKWLKGDPKFQAAYNQWHEEMQESCRARLMAMTVKAAGAIEKALEAGDARAALALLRGMGVLEPREKAVRRQESDLAFDKEMAAFNAPRTPAGAGKYNKKLPLWPKGGLR